VVLLVVGLVLFVTNTEGRSLPHNRAKRALTDGQRQYLIDLYNQFLGVFNDNYRQSDRSDQFAVATINEPDDLLPCGWVRKIQLLHQPR